MNMFDHPMYNCFVTPILCKDLLLAGLTKQTIYQWKIRDKVASLHTSAFDMDGYYKDALQVLDKYTDLILPAYSLKDVEGPLNDYLLTCSASGEYEVSLSTYYNLQSYKAPRLPDAFALLLYEAIRKGIISAEKINNKILQVITKY